MWWLASPVNIPKDPDGRYKAFYNLVLEVTQHHLYCVLLSSHGQFRLRVEGDYMRAQKGVYWGAILGDYYHIEYRF